MSDPLTTPPTGQPVISPDLPHPDAAATSSAKRRRHRPGRFVAGLVTGGVVAALVFGGVYIASDDDSGQTADSQPAASIAEPSTRTVAVTGGSLHDLVVAVRPAIVAIHTTVTETEVLGGELEGRAAGTGFVLSADGLIVTNNHVIENADQISVTLDDASTEPAELIAADPRSDLAVLRIDRTGLTPLAIGDSDAMRVGDPVVAIGNALDLGAEPTVTAGIVSAVERNLTEPNGQVLVNLIQTDAAINPGNSGGPLLDLTGRVVGINTVVAGQAQNIGFAIAIKPAESLIDQLRNGDVPLHALLGVSAVQPVDDSGVPVEGAEVTAVDPGSGADTAGLREGDVITALDGDVVHSPEDLVAAIASHQPGDVVGVTVERAGSNKQLTATLGAHDAQTS